MDFTYDEILEEATRRIQQKSLITLGGFGGYIVLGFPHPIPNVTGEYDFKIKAMPTTTPKPEQEHWEEVPNRELYSYPKMQTVMESLTMSGMN